MSLKKKKTRQSDISEAVLSSLECPVCTEYITPPIVFCENGHNVCSACRKRLFRCPTCQQSFLELRNRALEDIALSIEYPCRHRHLGCQESHRLDAIARHHGVCPFRNYPCLVAAARGCPWLGPRSQMKHHVVRSHPGDAVDLDADPKAPFASWDLPNTVSYRDSVQAVFCLGEIFVMDRKFDDARKKWFVALRYLGAAKDTEGFRYKLKMSCGGGRKVSFTDIPRAERDNLNEVMDAGLCISVDFDLLLHFVKGTRTLKISRVGGSVTEL